jgi:serine/threonine-protein kinase
VWEARDELDGERVAVKLLDSQRVSPTNRLQHFQAESRLSAKLSHPHVIAIYETGTTDDGVNYIVMEVVDGETLEQAIMRHRLEVQEICELFGQVLDTLDCAHAAGIVHRDLKPANIMLSYPRPGAISIKLLDFGAALGLLDDAPGSSAPGSLVGTPEYMSPEQALGDAIDHRSDLYSVGVLLYELLTGNHPTGGDTLTAILVNVLIKHPPPIRSQAPEVPPELDALTLAALSKSPKERPQSAREMRSILANHGSFTHER